MNEMLGDRVVVVIGGTKGLGLSAARACVRQGARVVVVGKEAEEADPVARELGEAGAVVIGDAMDSTTAVRAVSVAMERFDRFDALYHVAGGSGRAHGDGPLHELTDAGVDYTLGLNLKSVLYSNRAAVRSFMERSVSGVVLNMSSVLGYSPSPRYFATHTYAAAKSAIVGLTRSCAAHYAPRGIRFNTIAPGLVDTAMARRAADDPAIQRFIAAKQPLDGGRIAQPTDLDAAVVYLLSDSSRFVTGQVLSVDGGWSVSEGCGEAPC